MPFVKASPDRCGSWACPWCSARLGRKLAARLRERLGGLEETGRRVVLITLTADRKQFFGPRECYEFWKRNRSVSRALVHFGQAYDFDTAGQWLCKLELQEDGWPHFHILLIIPESLKLPRKGAFDEFWPYGFSNVRHDGAVRYLCKYACKPGVGMEETIRASGLPMKGIRWISVARGFWGTSRDAVDLEKTWEPIMGPDDWEALLDAQHEQEQGCADETYRLDDQTQGSEDLHVIKVVTCGQTCRAMLVECVKGGQLVVLRSRRVPVPCEQLREVLAEKCYSDPDYEIFAVTAAEWSDCIASLCLPQEVADHVQVLLSGGRDGEA